MLSVSVFVILLQFKSMFLIAYTSTETESLWNLSFTEFKFLNLTNITLCSSCLNQQLKLNLFEI